MHHGLFWFYSLRLNHSTYIWQNNMFWQHFVSKKKNTSKNCLSLMYIFASWEEVIWIKPFLPTKFPQELLRLLKKSLTNFFRFEQNKRSAMWTVTNTDFFHKNTRCLIVPPVLHPTKLMWKTTKHVFSKFPFFFFVFVSEDSNLFFFLAKVRKFLPNFSYFQFLPGL